MPIALILSGMACGALLTTAGLALWGSFRQVPRLTHAVSATRWLAGVLLLIGALFACHQNGHFTKLIAWQGNRGIPTPIARLILMAALAALPGIQRSHHRRSHRGNLVSILPALVLVGVSLFWKPGLDGAGVETSSLPVMLMELAITTSAGLGAQALSQSLGEIISPPPHVEGPALSTSVTYALLTLLVSGVALVNLWQRGSVEGKTVYESGLAGAWLAWSAVWLIPRRSLWLQSVLMSTAASVLIILAVGW